MKFNRIARLPCGNCTSHNSLLQLQITTSVKHLRRLRILYRTLITCFHEIQEQGEGAARDVRVMVGLAQSGDVAQPRFACNQQSTSQVESAAITFHHGRRQLSQVEECKWSLIRIFQVWQRENAGKH